MNLRLRCTIDDLDALGNARGHWERLITLPFAPFPGLLVGSHRVAQVLVCQGNYDGAGEIEVKMEPRLLAVADDSALRGQGWEWVEYE